MATSGMAASGLCGWRHGENLVSPRKRRWVWRSCFPLLFLHHVLKLNLCLIFYLLRSLYGPLANTGKCPEHLATSQLSFGASLPTGLSRLPTPGLFLCLNICLHLPLWNPAALAVMLGSVHMGKTMKSFLPGIVRIPLSESDDLWS